MAPLHRSFSLPTGNYVSRLKALSGQAAKDEVSNDKDQPSIQSLETPPSSFPGAPLHSAPLSDRRPALSSMRRASHHSHTPEPASAQDPGSAKQLVSPSSKKASPLLGSLKSWGKGSLRRRSVAVDVTVQEGKGLQLERTSSAQSNGTTCTAGTDRTDGTERRGRSRKAKSVIVHIPEKKEELTDTVPPPLPPNTYPPTSIPPPPLTPTHFDSQASDLLMGAINRGRPGSTTSSPNASSTDLRKSTSSTGGALAALGLRAAALGTANMAPPRSPEKAADSTPVATPAATLTPRASYLQASKPVGSGDRSSKNRAPSPFFRARRARDQARARDTSPEVGALKKDTNYPESEPESVAVTKKFRPQVSAYEDGDVDSNVSDDGVTEAETELDSEDDFSGTSDFDEEGILDEDGEVIFDEETEKNTEANAVFYEGDAGGLGGRSATDEIDDKPRDDSASQVLDYYGEEVEQDPLGEGPNVVVPPQSLFWTNPSSRQKKTSKGGLQMETSRPVFARDRCTITLTQGNPDGALEDSGKRMRRYVVLSDLSEESRYAVEWAIGTVARDGDEIFVISVKEDESKIDPKNWGNNDRAQKMRIQKERQTTALLLVKQVNSLLQRTRLQITVTCQFLHAKNSRHMLLDLIDFLEPTMVIVGSRGLGKLQGILLGSTSHYLVQKSSVPVMVARRRLLRPLRRTNPANLRHSPRVSLASASIEKAASSKQEDDVVDVAEEEGTTDEVVIAKEKKGQQQ
ncbi:hypothetical protein L198_01757 [Cryptococcus wingfieldii CBS 7118]|uniref:UspA domain-containing protein n=1 Tax=Cryptococcus wingfieldii CBS 7118 TaxID=1295528 RepID=A0A1E3JW98_9TREE|nr:hypothetical protein L198_01757 [Cryptococcus wingfieldii CBS 7118]ODO05070.1 hypothetical protein L198_01757 [Cryptococcus wingfieldii CBS 7118]